MLNIDPSIIDSCRKRNAKAEFALYKYCFEILMPVCYRYTKNDDDAADLMNKGFLKILTNLDKYDDSKSFAVWSKRVMVNVIIDEFRTNRQYRETIQQTDMEELGKQHHPLDFNEAEARLTEKEVHKLIAMLPEASRTVLNLYVFEGLSHKEIAEQMNITEGTSKWHLSNARNMLRKTLGNIFSGIKVHML
jgi:RNA polymerase sigma factor (sigma-70 family)